MSAERAVAFYCVRGCCRGCGFCSGMGIGCHQVPCRCDRPCTCTMHDGGDYVMVGCERHDWSADRRCQAWVQDGAWKHVLPDGRVWRGHYNRPCERLAKAGEANYCYWHKPA